MSHSKLSYNKKQIKVSLKPSKNQSIVDINEDMRRAEEFGVAAVDRGVEEFKSSYFRIGSFKFMLYKEVGPPPWPRPAIKFSLSRDKRFFGFMIGWRSTGYSFNVLKAKK